MSDRRHRYQVEAAERLPHDAHERCFVANSVAFPVTAEPAVTVRT